MLLPRARFGASLYNTPILLILRLFYQASSFVCPDSEPRYHHVRHLETQQAVSGDAALKRLGYFQKQTLLTKSAHRLFDRFEKISVTDWWSKLSASRSIYANYRVVSITWVKALASHLSHEFIQFVVEDQGGTRDRIIADRHENGDWIIVGWNWASMREPFEHHSLPLPLLSLTYEDEKSRPEFLSIVKVIADVTKRRPDYNVLREMCWWYAEAIFETAHRRYGGSVKEWAWASLRYSLILRTRALPRLALANQAEEFRKMNANLEEMKF